MMKTGEPYVMDYLENIDSEIKRLFAHVTNETVIKDRVMLWNITAQSPDENNEYAALD